ncbi:unnamed protein product [Microthlaspi erraticum]|uniref:CCHC-type domain-containing protein n=1 Tax=Microthlaspi erraticum TaxID=1685480 RepID=A0A6D2I3C6_9BRAS|nr:unnamed protein product [Microthlaspi erraticum]
MLEKTYTTFHKDHITLQQQYMLRGYTKCRGYTKFSDLIVALLVAEKNSELLIKNHMTRPTGSKAFPEANALDVKKPVKENNSFRGRGGRNNRGRGGRGRYNPNNKRCGTKGHWSRNCRTPRHLCTLYKDSAKGKGKEVNLAEHSEGTTHLDASDFADDFDDTVPSEV